MLPSVLSKKKLKKAVKKNSFYGRDLVITIKLAQFLIDRAQSGTYRFRILPGVSRTKKFEKVDML